MTTMNTMYGATARFDTGRAMTEDELRRAAPSIFATTAHSSRSERFRTIPTIEILRGLANEGFFPVGARQCVSRARDRAPFAKHLVRLRKLDDNRKLRTGDTVFEALLQNANDGSSASSASSASTRWSSRAGPSMPSRSAIPATPWRM